jgi:hypothetical protein
MIDVGNSVAGGNRDAGSPSEEYRRKARSVFVLAAMNTVLYYFDRQPRVMQPSAAAGTCVCFITRHLEVCGPQNRYATAESQNFGPILQDPRSENMTLFDSSKTALKLRLERIMKPCRFVFCHASFKPPGYSRCYSNPTANWDRDPGR